MMERRVDRSKRDADGKKVLEHPSEGACTSHTTAGPRPLELEQRCTC